jgi:regulator of protease activity HflC (stomatin/prohibitin superfamily)
LLFCYLYINEIILNDLKTQWSIEMPLTAKEQELQNIISQIEESTERKRILTEYKAEFEQKYPVVKDVATIIKTSPYRHIPQHEVMQEIITEFNQKRPSIMTKALQWLGFLINIFFKSFKRVEPGMVQLVSRNNIPELVKSSSTLRRINITFNPYTTSIDHGIVKQTEPLIGKFGHYVLNVPLGSCAKVSFGNENMLYGEGQHVIHNQNFVIPEDYLAKINDPYIKHNDIHIFNVKPGHYAKITIGYIYYLLPPGNHKIRDANLVFNECDGFVSQTDLHISHGNKHVFNIPTGMYCKIRIGQEYKLLSEGQHFIESANLSFNKATDFISQTSLHINHGNIHILNIPEGKMALVLNNNIPRILTGGQHVIDNANFKFDEQTMLLPQNQSYVQHQNIHYITVTPGHIALISVDNETRILPSRTEPYIFQSNNFSIYKQNNQYTFDQNTKHISFNGKHYLLPDQGEIAVLYDGAELIIRPDLKEQAEKEHPLLADNETKAFIINSGTARFAEFLDTRTQTLEFPSYDVVDQRINEGEDKHNARFDKFKTADNVNVAVRFVVTYKITDPKLALKELKSRAEIERHIETLVNADMGNAIGNTTSSHLMSSEQSKARLPIEEEEKEDGLGKSVENPFFWQDKVKNTLHEDLLEVGIELGRLNIEETFILDESVRKKMEEQSITATSAQAEMSILHTQNQLAKRKALQEREMQKYTEETEAATAQVKADLGTKQAHLQTTLAQTVVDRENAITISKTKAESEKKVLEAEADKKIAILKAEAELITKQKEAEGKQAILASQSVTAKILEENPAMLQLEIAKLLASALQSSQYLPVASILSNQNPIALMTGLLGQLSGQASKLRESPAQLLQQQGLFSVPASENHNRPIEAIGNGIQVQSS